MPRSLSDFSVSAQAGPEAPVLFEPNDGSDLSSLRVPGLYTYAGFRLLSRTARQDRAGAGRRPMGDRRGGGEQGGFDQELLKLGPELLDRYGKGFAAAWNEVLDKLKFKPMAADKPQYLALSAAGSPTSPMMQLFEAIARETALTREPRSGDAPGRLAERRMQRDRAKGLARIGIELAARKSQSRAGAAFVKPRARIRAPASKRSSGHSRLWWPARPANGRSMP